MDGFLEYLTLGNALLALLLLLLLIQLIEIYQFRGMPPGPRFSSLPVLGNILLLAGNPPGENLFNNTRSLREKYGEIFSMKLGSYKAILVSEPEDVKEALIHKSADFAGRPPWHSFIYTSLGGKNIPFGNYGPAWKLHRKLLITALRRHLSNSQLVESRVGVQAERMMKYFDQQDGQALDPSRIVMESVANVICAITFGDRFNSSHSDFDELLSLLENEFRDLAQRVEITIFDLFSFAQYLPFKAYKLNKQIIDREYQIVTKQLEERKRDFDPSEKVNDLISALLKARSEADATEETLLSDDHLKCTLLDMFTAGSETTSTTIIWALAFLGNYPAYQDEAQQQMDQVVGRDGMPVLADRPNLPMIQAIVMETLRLGNIADSALPHYALKDTTLRGYRVPKDTVILVCLESVHLNPQCWQNPNVFDPHRHISSDGQLITNQDNFLPFSAGRRACAGEALARVELFMFLSLVLHKYSVAADNEHGMPGLKRIKGFSQYPAPYKLRVVKRK